MFKINPIVHWKIYESKSKLPELYVIKQKCIHFPGPVFFFFNKFTYTLKRNALGYR